MSERRLHCQREGERERERPHLHILITPSCSANGDIVFGCDDSTVRVFTRSAERAAPAEVRLAYEEAVAVSVAAQASQQVTMWGRVHRIKQ